MTESLRLFKTGPLNMFHSFNSIHTQPRTGSRCRADSAIALSSWCPTFRQSAADRVSEKTWRSLRSSCVCASRSLRCGATSAPAPRARRFPEAPFCLRRPRTRFEGLFCCCCASACTSERRPRPVLCRAFEQHSKKHSKLRSQNPILQSARFGRNKTVELRYL